MVVLVATGSSLEPREIREVGRWRRMPCQVQNWDKLPLLTHSYSEDLFKVTYCRNSLKRCLCHMNDSTRIEYRISDIIY